MKTCLTAIVLSFALVAIQASQQAPFTASIEGVVVKTGAADVRLQLPTTGQTNVAAGIGDPLSGATVELTGVEGGRVRSYSMKTGRDGKFQFRNLPAGSSYQLVAILSPDYLPGQYGQVAPGVPGAPISLAPGQQIKDLRIPLFPAGAISGRVISPDGAHISSWPITLIRPFYVDGQRVLGALPSGKTGVVATTHTDKRGEYQFAGLPPGEYYIQDSVGNFYTKRSAQPAALHLRPGESLKTVDLTITLTATRNVSGYILDAARVPVRSAEIALVRREAAAAAASARFRRAGPEFSLDTASTGAYLILARSVIKGSPVFGYAFVEIGSADISNIEIIVAPPSDISGLVTGAPEGARVDIRLRPLLPGMANAPVSGVSPGFIAVGVSAGDYRVEASPTGEAYVKSIRMGSRESLDGIIQVNGQPNVHLEIAMSPAGGTISGRVVNETRESVRNVRAVLIPDRARRGRHDLYKAVLTDEQGEFEMHGVAPGNYMLYAWQTVQDGAWLDPNFLSFYESLGKPLSVEERSRITVQATPISPWR